MLVSKGHFNTVQGQDRYSGTVTWFKPDKGFGFIKPDGDDTDVFVHYSGILGRGIRNLYEGERVEFALGKSVKEGRLQAIDVAVVGKAVHYRVNQLVLNDSSLDELLFMDNRDMQLKQLVTKVESALRSGQVVHLYVTQEIVDEV